MTTVFILLWYVARRDVPDMAFEPSVVSCRRLFTYRHSYPPAAERYNNAPVGGEAGALIRRIAPGTA